MRSKPRIANPSAVTTSGQPTSPHCAAGIALFQTFDPPLAPAAPRTSILLEPLRAPILEPFSLARKPIAMCVLVHVPSLGAPEVKEGLGRQQKTDEMLALWKRRNPPTRPGPRAPAEITHGLVAVRRKPTTAGDLNRREEAALKKNQAECVAPIGPSHDPPPASSEWSDGANLRIHS